MLINQIHRSTDTHRARSSESEGPGTCSGPFAISPETASLSASTDRHGIRLGQVYEIIATAMMGRFSPTERLRLEARALAIVDRALAGQKVEDSLVELKSVWPTPVASARRLAAQANFARGEEVLWLIGVDEKNRVACGAPQHELATWWAQVRKVFDGSVPGITDLVFERDGVAISLLIFETTGFPYVVRTGDEAVSREVPWREATGVRSATRDNLVSLLAPLALTPSMEPISASLTVELHKESGWAWGFQGRLYAVPRIEGLTVVPYHRSVVHADLIFGEGERAMPVEFEHPRLGPTQTLQVGRSRLDMLPQSRTIESTDTEVLLHGPGMVEVRARATTFPFQVSQPSRAEVSIRLRPAGSDAAAVAEFTLLSSRKKSEAQIARWAVGEE